MEAPKVKRVVIAGGGTAGWATAAALAQQLGSLLDITLVESDEIGAIGVGEATFPSILGFHRLLKLDERAFLRESQATFKLGISFEDWGKIGDRYLHAFGTIGRSTWMGDFQHLWLAGREIGLDHDIGDYCFERQAARAGKFAIFDKSKIHYAYHFDAALYAGHLRRLSEPKGVRRVEGKIVGVRQSAETGFIEALELESGAAVEGDLFVDCTGFRALLIGRTLQVGYEDYGRWLKTDSALAAPTAAPADGAIPPYTRAIARGAGWRWRIPLQHRIGNGLVYSSRYVSDEDARADFLGGLDGAPAFEPRLIRFTPGRRLRAWDKNCVAIGLSSGFIEPLESTSIHLIQIGVTRLMQLFPFAGVSPTIAWRYNEQSRIEYECVRDFIIMHYKATQRTDTEFWRDCAAMETPGALAERIALFEEHGLAYQGSEEMFRVDSWLQVLIGQGIMPKSYHHLGRMLGPDRLRMALESLKGNIRAAVDRMPRHEDFLRAYCAQPSAEAPAEEPEAQALVAR